MINFIPPIEKFSSPKNKRQDTGPTDKKSSRSTALKEPKTSGEKITLILATNTNYIHVMVLRNPGPYARKSLKYWPTF